MDLFRFSCISSGSCNSAADRMASGACDVLQMDWCQKKASDDALNFLSEWKRLHKHFFLDHRLRMITNAGAGGVVSCVEELGEYLREHGDPQVPLTAVRGENVVSRLGEMLAEGVTFADELTDERIPITSPALVSAQVELGAGPIVTALDEGSRIIVLGSYDPAAPFVAAGYSTLDITWQDYEILGGLALASVLSERFAMTADLDRHGIVSLKPNRTDNLSSKSIEDWMKTSLRDGMICADVSCNFKSLCIDQVEQKGFQLKGLSASPPDDDWRVKFGFQFQDGQQHVCWSRVPRDAINISVDTRTASEWL